MKKKIYVALMMGLLLFVVPIILMSQTTNILTVVTGDVVQKTFRAPIDSATGLQLDTLIFTLDLRDMVFTDAGQDTNLVLHIVGDTSASAGVAPKVAVDGAYRQYNTALSPPWDKTGTYAALSGSLKVGPSTAQNVNTIYVALYPTRYYRVRIRTVRVGEDTIGTVAVTAEVEGVVE